MSFFERGESSQKKGGSLVSWESFPGALLVSSSLMRDFAIQMHRAVREPEQLELLVQAELPGFLRKAEFLCGEDGSPGVFHCAVLAGERRSVELLLDAGADINEQDSLGRTPLIHACFEGNMSLVRCLLRHGANVNLIDNDGQNCAHSAFCMDHTMLGDWLLSRTEVDTDTKDSQGKTPLDWRELCCRDGEDDIYNKEGKAHDDPDVHEEPSDRELSLVESPSKNGSHAFVINGRENNFAAGAGLRAIKWLKKGENGVLCCDA